jgi:putative pyruvate formate lyase activating enzyme
MRFIAQEISTQTYISLMSQYAPYYKAGQFPAISRQISNEEYEQARQIMEKFGLSNGWIQGSSRAKK